MLASVSPTERSISFKARAAGAFHVVNLIAKTNFNGALEPIFHSSGQPERSV
ncbi:hypothetical protein OH492_00535 [Vibrio chagasii]|nr:hypothetical protein [Vibrio chagasii]